MFLFINESIHCKVSVSEYDALSDTTQIQTKTLDDRKIGVSSYEAVKYQLSDIKDPNFI